MLIIRDYHYHGESMKDNKEWEYIFRIATSDRERDEVLSIWKMNKIQNFKDWLSIHDERDRDRDNNDGNKKEYKIEKGNTFKVRGQKKVLHPHYLSE